MGITYTEPLFNRRHYLTDNSLASAKRAIKKVENAASEEERLTEIKKLLSVYEKGALAIRQEIQQYEMKNEVFFEELTPDCVKNLPVCVELKEDALIVKTPITIKKSNKETYSGKSETYLLSQYVYTAIKKMQRENGISDQELFQRFDEDKFDLVFIIKRNARLFNPSLHCDNDNLENSTIQNEICSALALGDSCQYIDHIYSCFRYTQREDEVGTEFIITGRKNLAKYTEKDT